MYTIFSQQILSDRLLLVVIGGQKSNLSYRFKLEPITTYHLRFILKYYEVYVALLNKERKQGEE